MCGRTRGFWRVLYASIAGVALISIATPVYNFFCAKSTNMVALSHTRIEDLVRPGTSCGDHRRRAPRGSTFDLMDPKPFGVVREPEPGAVLTLLSHYLARNRSVFVLNACLGIDNDNPKYPQCPHAELFQHGSLRFHCVYEGGVESDGEVFPPLRTEDRLCFGNYRVECALPKELKCADSTQVSLYWDNSPSLVWSNVRPRLSPIPLPPPAAAGETPPLKLAMCTSWRAGYNGVSELFAWLAYHRIQGVQHIFLYVWAPLVPGKKPEAHSAHAKMLRRIRAWVDNGFVTLIPWVKDSYGKLICASEDASYYDCTGRARGIFEWISNAHLDEFLRPMGEYRTVEAVLDDVPDEVDEARMYEFGWVSQRSNYDVVDNIEDDDLVFRQIENGTLRRPDRVWTRLGDVRSGNKEATIGQQPFEGIMRLSRWAGMTAEGGKGYLGVRNSTKKWPLYRWWDPKTELSLAHLSIGWVNYGSDGIQGADMEPRSTSEAFNLAGVQASLRPVTFRHESGFGARYRACVRLTIAAHGLVPSRCIGGITPG